MTRFIPFAIRLLSSSFSYGWTRGISDRKTEKKVFQTASSCSVPALLIMLFCALVRLDASLLYRYRALAMENIPFDLKNFFHSLSL
ncbi:hypothetical protein BDV38DRAFT_189590 [Aspergillus pseudotamarii]|uniref:Uncharacterized protein n=1 Tax=Aspergillus pseudotamarii TaxID=132259 RepID=A0A5N6T5I1_ASPPS|nr:uncharacterized protein BDV38DRAFT_189590 [Aspergillus pseudotamarii]KAE8141573.1 hypothetical protein BDV38DRAFT_189590 [Aspergillus pseudotamarii]